MTMTAIDHGQMAAAGRYPGKDPHFSNVRFLLRGESATDSSSDGRVVTATGVTYSNAVAKFGNAGQYPNTTGTFFQSPAYTSTLQLGAGDFTVEGWINKVSHAAGTGNQCFYQHGPLTGATGANGLGLYLTTAGGIDWAALNTYFCGVPASTLALNTWYHVALVRSSGTSAIFLNGKLNSNLAATNSTVFKFETCTNNFNAQTGPPRIGGSVFSNSSLRGAFDDARLTVGVARYLSDFTPPQRPFQTS